MGSVIKMDFYRLFTSLSFKICLGVVFLINLAEGPITKLVFNIGKSLLEGSDDPDAQKSLAEMGEWIPDFDVGNLLADGLGVICTAVFLLCIVYFCFADIQHGYIKNIAGQLPSRGHTIVSKYVVIQFTTILFFIVTFVGNIAGQLIVGRSLKFEYIYRGALNFDTGIKAPDEVFTMGQAFATFGVKFLLLSGMCALILLLTTGIGSNVAGTIAAILCGGGFTGLAYSGISAGIDKLFKTEDFELGDYMPDSLYRSELVKEGFLLRGLIVAVITIVVLMFITTRLYNKKDIK